ncbi:hypothetical protein RIF29_29828 [Crotalaria pallida]|uniref:DUF4218 domain-containing protein n=1 Tax=Crotalaria pallida TaxID=3830 RepID=A0AAN9EHD7_CROPI
MEHLPVHLAYEAMLGGPIQYRWMYPFERFMDDSKRSVKNKAKVEGSICASYLHRETTFFCSHYFKRFMLVPRNNRNEMESETDRHPPTLSIFNQPGRYSGKQSKHWLTEAEWNSAHVHILINCNELKPYHEEFLQSDSNASASTYTDFPIWFKQQGSQSMPIHDNPDEDLNEDALPDGLLPDLPPGWIMPTAKGFFPSKEASKNITNTLKDVFRHPVTSYHQIDEEIRNNVFFERFRTLVKWDPAHEEQVKVLFHSKASKRLSDIFNQARKQNKRPSWIGRELWETLLALFDKPEEKDKRQKAKENRASSKGGSMYTGGSVNQIQHAQDM